MSTSITSYIAVGATGRSPLRGEEKIAHTRRGRFVNRPYARFRRFETFCMVDQLREDKGELKSRKAQIRWDLFHPLQFLQNIPAVFNVFFRFRMIWFQGQSAFPFLNGLLNLFRNEKFHSFFIVVLG